MAGGLAASCALLVLVGCGRGTDKPSRVQLSSSEISVDGAVIHYRRGGRGPPLLLFHGFMNSGWMWERFAGDLGQHHTLLIPDFPGHGYSTGRPEVWSTKRVATQMFEFLDRLGVRRVRAIGCSVGANVLIHMALQQPDRLDAMVLISGSHRLTESVRRGLRSLTAEPAEFREWNAKNSPHGERQTLALLALLRGVADNYEDFSTPLDELAAIPTRTLIVSGDRDQGPSLETTLALHHALPNSGLWVVPNAGHCPFWRETPGGSAQAEHIFSGVVLDFFEQGA